MNMLNVSGGGVGTGLWATDAVLISCLCCY